MMENEAIKEIKRWTGILMSAGSQCVMETAEAQDMAIKALEEIQAYRELGTFEELKRVVAFIGDDNYSIVDELKLLNQYRAIGTVAEVKALKEKADLYEQAFYLLLKDDCKKLPEGWTGSIDELYVGRKQFYLDKVEKTKVLGKIKA